MYTIEMMDLQKVFSEFRDRLAQRRPAVMIPLDELEHLPTDFKPEDLQKSKDMLTWPGRRESAIVIGRVKGGKYLMLDGWHRLKAARMAGDKTILAHVI